MSIVKNEIGSYTCIVEDVDIKPPHATYANETPLCCGVCKKNSP